MRLTLGLTLLLAHAPPICGDLVRSLFRRTELLLRRRAYREALFFVADKDTLDRYRDPLDFLFCEIVDGWRDPCFRYYADDGPPLRDAPEATPAQIAAWDELLRAAVRVAFAALEMGTRPAWAELRAAAAKEIERAPRPPAPRPGAASPAEVLEVVLDTYALDDLVELADKLRVDDARRRSKSELVKLVAIAGRTARRGPHLGTGVAVLRLVKPNRRRRQPLLSEARPDLVAEWHPHKNGDATPDDFTAGCAASAWWLCARDPGHEWFAGIRHRARAGSGCPYCSGNAIGPGTNLAARFPEIAREWLFQKNGPLPDDLAPSDPRRVWWCCGKGHTWRATVLQRAIGGTGCPRCPRRPPTPRHNLAVVHPELAREWHPTKNGVLRAEDVNPGQREAVWWQCRKNAEHAYRSTIGNRVHNGNGCPICSNRRVLPENSLAAKFPLVAAEWHPTLNGAVTAEGVPPKTPKKYWWRCAAGHEWRAQVGSRTIFGYGCRACYLERRRARVLH